MMVALRYLGEGQFHAPSAFSKKLDAALVIGEVLRWEQVQERSAKSHAHYFAVIADAWANLPEALADDLPSPEHLRKYALVKAGYCNETKMVFRTNAEAIAGASFIGGMDGFAICEVVGPALTVWTAKSQSMRAMNKKEFQESKDAVLRVISGLIGADAAQAGMAA